MDFSCPKIKQCQARAREEDYKFNCAICKHRNGKPIVRAEVTEEKSKSIEREVKTMETEKTSEKKICKKCGNPYPATAEFYSRNASTPDGLERWCKKCKQKDSSDRRANKLVKKPTRKQRGSYRKQDNNGSGISIPPNGPGQQKPQENVTIALPIEVIIAIKRSVVKEMCQKMMKDYGIESIEMR